jgi:hypothetical protein
MSDQSEQKRPVSIIEQIGERCLQVCKDHASKSEADLEMIADFMWALGVRMEIRFEERKP